MTLALALSLALSVPTEAQLLHGIAGVESRWDVHAPDGDLDRPICRRSVGQYQVRPIAVRELVRVGMLKPMPGFSLTNCTGIRKWLAVPANNKRAATLYLRLMIQREGRVEWALAAYNGGGGCRSETCLRYAGAVLLIAAGEE